MSIVFGGSSKLSLSDMASARHFGPIKKETDRTFFPRSQFNSVKQLHSDPSIIQTPISANINSSKELKGLAGLIQKFFKDLLEDIMAITKGKTAYGPLSRII